LAYDEFGLGWRCAHAILLQKNFLEKFQYIAQNIDALISTRQAFQAKRFDRRRPKGGELSFMSVVVEPPPH
jgi:hypothetical protein